MELRIDLNTICLLLYTIKKAIKVICNKQMQIRNLKKYLEDDDEYFFISNGSILDENQTFEKASITDWSIIFAIQKKNKHTDAFQKMMRISNDSEFELKLKITFSPDLKSEYLRLKDMVFKKIETKSRNYKFNQLDDLNDLSKKKDVVLKINYKQPNEPENDPLPIIW